MTADRVVVGFLDNHTWSACFGLSLRDLYLRDLGAEGRIIRTSGKELRKVAGTMGVADGRNQVAREFLDTTDGDWLMFIDTDMGFDPDAVDRLIASADPIARPVMGGLCFALRRVEAGPAHSERFGVIPTVYHWVETEAESGFAPIQRYPQGQVFEVGATGAAFLLIHRSALAKVRKRQGDSWFDPIKHPTADHGRPRTFSEDLSFCVRLQAAGVPVHVDSSVRTVHHKGGVFLDETIYLGQQQAAEPAPTEAEPVPV